MSRAAWLARLRMQSCALGAHLFPPSKWAGLFPSAAYRRSAPPQLTWGILTSCGLKGFLRLGCFATQKREACASPQWTAGRLTHCGAEYYRGNKGQRVFFCTLAFLASHEARRRMAVCTGHQTGNHTRPASREACCRAAVASRPSRMSFEQPRALWRGIGCRASPCQTGEPRDLSPSGGSFTAKPHVVRAAPRPKGAVWGAGL